MNFFLFQIGLLEDYNDSEEDNINALFKIALERIAFIPFGLLIDTYRWDIFRKNVTESGWNQHWEDLRFFFNLNLFTDYIKWYLYSL